MCVAGQKYKKKAGVGYFWGKYFYRFYYFVRISKIFKIGPLNDLVMLNETKKKKEWSH